jgi:calcineurin-like phosphoesterase family protein
MNRVFFTADTHFGHANIIKYCNRPFLTAAEQDALKRDGELRVSEESTERMNAALIHNINSLVDEGDTIWHLGDWAMGGSGGYYERCRQFRDRVVCRTVNIVWGNHDSRTIRDLFNQAHDQVEISVAGQKIALNHYAMAVWQDSHKGAWHCYGHSHSQAEAWLDTHMPGRRSIDVGVDNAARLLGMYRPWAFEELKTLLEGREGYAIDHHGRRKCRSLI